MATAAPTKKIDSKPPRADARSQSGFARHLRYRRQALLTGDFIAAGLALLAAAALRRWVRDPAPLATANWLSCAAAVSVFLSWDAIESRRRGIASRPAHAALAFFLASATCATALFYYRSAGFGVSRLTLMFFTAFGTAAQAAWHDLMRRRSNAAHPRNLVLVGDPTACDELARTLRAAPGVSVSHILHDLTQGLDEGGGQLGRTEELLRSEAVDEILLVPRQLGSAWMHAGVYSSIVELCQRTNTKFYVYASWLHEFQQVQVDYLDRVPVLSFSFAPDAYWPCQFKRWFDVAIASLLLLLTAPILALAACGIVFESGRPVFFSQTRCGLRGRTFRLYKLRTMVHGAEGLQSHLAHRNEMSGPVFKIRDDPRITRLGRWLRRLSIDELPQLWNVLRGNMSLIGPRPPTVDEIRQYRLTDHRRLAMKPGITGMWQVSGRNQIADFAVWVELDNQYIRNWSLLGDLAILWRTVWTVLRMTGR